MPESVQNTSLLPYNTFGIDVKTDWLVKIRSVTDFQKFILTNEKPLLILGGGSNVLLVHDWLGVTILNKIEGIEIVRENESEITLNVGSGVVWQDLVSWAVERDYGGIENLTWIPGTVGAAPIQNIGAYGVEIKDVLSRVEYISLADGKLYQINKDECNFGYRDSIFKQDLRNEAFISSIEITLTKKDHKLSTHYGDIEKVLREKHLTPSVKNISKAVQSIRESKIPDPKQLGNSGSFFKNPVISIDLLKKIKQSYPVVPHYPVDEQLVKVPAGWLIEQCQWKGFRKGAVGVHKNQALILVNYGGAKGEEIVEIALEIQQSVKDKFEIELEFEVRIID